MSIVTIVGFIRQPHASWEPCRQHRCALAQSNAVHKDGGQPHAVTALKTDLRQDEGNEQSRGGLEPYDGRANKQAKSVIQEGGG